MNRRWSKDTVLLERLVRMRAEGVYLQDCAKAFGVRWINHVYRSKRAKNLCRKLGIPYHYKKYKPCRYRRPKFSVEMLETFVRLRYEEKRSWQEIAQITGFRAWGIRMQVYHKAGKEARLSLGHYKTKNLLAKLVGRKFGRLKVIRFAGFNSWGQSTWHCRCSCGKTNDVVVSNLTRGLTKSCGDNSHRPRGKASARYKHGGPSNPKLKPSWNSYHAMLSRCFRESDIGYQAYGARGITVCSHWREPDGFTNFLKSLGRRPKDKTLDRRDPNGHYSCGSCAECVAKGWPANVRWASNHVQANNKRRHYPPLTPEQQEELRRSKDPFLNPYSEEPVF